MYSTMSEATSSVISEVKSAAKSALVVSLCYRGQDNYVKGEGTGWVEAKNSTQPPIVVEP